MKQLSPEKTKKNSSDIGQISSIEVSRQDACMLQVEVHAFLFEALHFRRSVPN